MPIMAEDTSATMKFQFNSFESPRSNLFPLTPKVSIDEPFAATKNGDLSGFNTVVPAAVLGRSDLHAPVSTRNSMPDLASLILKSNRFASWEYPDTFWISMGFNC